MQREFKEHGHTTERSPPAPKLVPGEPTAASRATSGVEGKEKSTNGVKGNGNGNGKGAKRSVTPAIDDVFLRRLAFVMRIVVRVCSLTPALVGGLPPPACCSPAQARSQSPSPGDVSWALASAFPSRGEVSLPLESRASTQSMGLTPVPHSVESQRFKRAQFGSRRSVPRGVLVCGAAPCGLLPANTSESCAGSCVAGCTASCAVEGELSRVLTAACGGDGRCRDGTAKRRSCC
jgi:hypothetical protein